MTEDAQDAEAASRAVASADGEARWITVRNAGPAFHTEIAVRDHRLAADEPTAVGGADTGPTPYDFLLFAIASCTAITLRMYANRKGWPVGDILVDVRRTRSHEVDAEWSDRAKVGLYTVEERIDFRGPVSVEQRARLMTIADRCPVKRTLENGVRVVRPGRDGGGIGT